MEFRSREIGAPQALTPPTHSYLGGFKVAAFPNTLLLCSYCAMHEPSLFGPYAGRLCQGVFDFEFRGIHAGDSSSRSISLLCSAEALGFAK